MAYLTGWSYRKSITVSRASGAVTDYQMKILVGESSGATGENVDCNSHCLQNFNDLRFTTSDGTTLLKYWIESITGTTPNQLATVWVKFDSIGTGATTFYMYYGNAGASAYSSGDDTFLLFDHFDDGSLNTSKWDIAVKTPYSITESGSNLVLEPSNTTGYSGCGIMAKNAMSSVNISVEALFFRDCPYNNNGGLGFYIGATNKSAQDTTYYGEWVDVAGLSISQYAGYYSFALYKAAYRSAVSTNIFNKWSRGAAKLQSGRVDTELIVEGTTYTNYCSSTSVNSVYPQVHAADYQHHTVNYCDWVFIRQWLSTEPAFGSWGTEEVLSTGLTCGLITGSAYKSAIASSVMVGGTWKPITSGMIKVNGIWKQLV